MKKINRKPKYLRNTPKPLRQIQTLISKANKKRKKQEETLKKTGLKITSRTGNIHSEKIIPPVGEIKQLSKPSQEFIETYKRKIGRRIYSEKTYLTRIKYNGIDLLVEFSTISHDGGNIIIQTRKGKMIDMEETNEKTLTDIRKNVMNSFIKDFHKKRIK